MNINKHIFKIPQAKAMKQQRSWSLVRCGTTTRAAVRTPTFVVFGVEIMVSTEQKQNKWANYPTKTIWEGTTSIGVLADSFQATQVRLFNFEDTTHSPCGYLDVGYPRLSSMWCRTWWQWKSWMKIHSSLGEAESSAFPDSERYRPKRVQRLLFNLQISSNQTGKSQAHRIQSVPDEVWILEDFGPCSGGRFFFWGNRVTSWCTAGSPETAEAAAIWKDLNRGDAAWPGADEARLRVGGTSVFLPKDLTGCVKQGNYIYIQ